MLRQQHQKGAYHGNYRENQEGVEIGKSRGLLFAKILKRLQCHPVRRGQISSLLQEALLDLSEMPNPARTMD